jgi:hypothetical protein
MKAGSSPGFSCVAFRDKSVHKLLGYFGTCPTPERAKRPTFNATTSAPRLHLVGRAILGSSPKTGGGSSQSSVSDT